MKRIKSVTYRGADEPGDYTDLLIALPKSWTDEYHYDAEGKMTGWTRRRGERTEEFTPEGRLIVSRDPQGQAVQTVAVRYVARLRGPNQSPVIVQVTDGGNAR